MSRISVIVPIYNVEKYLNRCVDSILNQTFADFECILIDDGSPDNCGKICDEYAEKDKRIRVIHKENGGLSDARNAGIKVAQGEYLSFIDSDDWIHPQMLEILYNGITKNDVLVSVCAYERVETEKPFKNIKNPEYEILKGMDFFTEDNVTAVVAWNKLYHKSLFDSIRYPVGKIHEDEFTTYKILYKAGNIAFCSEKMYMYFVNNTGITKGVYSLKQLNEIEAISEQLKFFKDKRLDLCYKFAMRNIMRVYWNNYLMTKDLYIAENRMLSKKMRRALILNRRQVNINIKTHANYYEMAFPRFMWLYWRWEILIKSFRDNGIISTVNKIIRNIKNV